MRSVQPLKVPIYEGNKSNIFCWYVIGLMHVHQFSQSTKQPISKKWRYIRFRDVTNPVEEKNTILFRILHNIYPCYAIQFQVCRCRCQMSFFVILSQKLISSFVTASIHLCFWMIQNHLSTGHAMTIARLYPRPSGLNLNQNLKVYNWVARLFSISSYYVSIKFKGAICNIISPLGVVVHVHHNKPVLCKSSVTSVVVSTEPPQSKQWYCGYNKTITFCKYIIYKWEDDTLGIFSK